MSDPFDDIPFGDEPAPGGLGVQLIYAVCDKVEIEPANPEGNRVSMSVKRPAAEG